MFRPKQRSCETVRVFPRVAWACHLIASFLFLASTALAASPTKLGDLNADGILDVFDLAVLRQHIRQTTPLPKNLRPFADLNGDGFLNEDDAIALIQNILGASPAKTLPLASIRETSPFAGESGVALTREIILRFTMPLSVNATLTTWDANTQTPGDLQAEAGGRKLLTRVELSGDRTKATLFFLEPVPASTHVTVTFDGVGLNDLLERQIDPVGDHLATGGVFTFTYDTAPITPVPGTGIIGHVYASERKINVPQAPGITTDTPLGGVLVRVVGSEDLFTFTAADGSFALAPCPTGRFFVEVDGRPVTGGFPNGDYYPIVQKTWEALPGKLDNLAAATGQIFLPIIHGADRVAVSATEETVVPMPASFIAQNPALAGVQLTMPPNGLFSDDGTRGGTVTMAPVPPDRLPEPLPPGLAFPVVITIQTDGGTSFDRPVPVRFPNLLSPTTGEKLPPGAKSALWTFNHDLGTWQIQGPMTVTDDGEFVVTDVGVGVRQPGWVGTQPGSQAEGGGAGEPRPCTDCTPLLNDMALAWGEKTSPVIASAAFGASNALKLAAGGSRAAAAGLKIVFDYSLSLAMTTAKAIGGDAEGKKALRDHARSTAVSLGLETAEAIAPLTRPKPFHWLGPAWYAGADAAFQDWQPFWDKYKDYEKCVLTCGPPPAAAASSRSRGAKAVSDNDVFAEQLQVLADINEVFASLFGSRVWIQVAPVDVEPLRDFLLALDAAQTRDSRGGARIVLAEQVVLDAMPLPSNISASDRRGLIDRFDRMAVGELSAHEINAAGILAAALRLQETARLMIERGRDNVFNGFLVDVPAVAIRAQKALDSDGVVKTALFYKVTDLGTGRVQRGRLSDSGVFGNLIVAPETLCLVEYATPESLQVAFTFYLSGANGSSGRIPSAPFLPPVLADVDTDGLSDVFEAIIGTNVSDTDTDNDGICLSR